MPNPQEEAARKQCQESLKRIHDFDIKSLVREEELGRDFNFNEVLPDASRLMVLYAQISPTVLEDLPNGFLNTLKTTADADFNRFANILKFVTRQDNPHAVRNNLIQQVSVAYEGTFNSLHPIISYSTSKSADFKRLENESRARIQAIEDKANEVTKQLEEDRKVSTQILEDIRKMAVEQGVTQQAIYFGNQATEHEKDAVVWASKTLKMSYLLGGYAVLTLFLHKISFLKPENAYQTVQFAVSKILIFAVLSYMLYLATKNYLAQKHNAVINKHRQNALMTYKAIADAAKDAANREVILTHASACIFSPQPTGFSSAQIPEGPVAKSAIELLGSTMNPRTP